MNQRLGMHLLAGVLFAFGLAISGMTQPQKVIGFLDLANGWDPSLAFVMVGAIGIHAVAYFIKRRLDKPLMAETFQVPTSTVISKELIIGAVLFGVGWALAGFCPGPALTSVVTGNAMVLVFVACMFIGMFGYTKLMQPK